MKFVRRKPIFILSAIFVFALLVILALGQGCGRVYKASVSSLQVPSSSYSGATFSPQPSFSYLRSNDSSDSFQDSVKLTAYADSGCSTAAPGTLSVTTNPLIVSNVSSASFSGVSYALSHVEGTIYLGAQGADTGQLICSSAIPISQHFNVGFGYVVSGTTGAAGETGASERDNVITFFINSTGQYVAIGSSKNSSGGTEVALWRYNPDGTLDTTFGTSAIGLSGATGAGGATGASEADIPLNAQIDSSGRYVVVGSSVNGSGGQEMAMWRFTSAGLLDTSFGSGTGSIVYGVVGAAGATGASELDAGTSLLISSSTGDFIIGGYSANTSAGVEATIWRYTSAGALDTTFATVGYTSFGTTGAAGATGASEDDLPEILQTDSSGNYILVGTSKNTSNGVEAAIWRYTNVGVLDTTFASGAGVVVFGSTGAAGATGASELDAVNDFKLDGSGNYILVGSSKNGSGGQELAIWRYTNIGALDTTFNTTGTFVSGTTGTAGASGASEKDSASSLFIDTSGRYVISGSSNNASNGKEMVFWRVTTAGAFDTTLGTTGAIKFGTTGAAGATIASEKDNGNKIQVDSNGRFVISGSSYNAGGGQEAAFWRYLSIGTPEI